MDDAETQEILAWNIRTLARRRKMALKNLPDFAGTGKSQLFRVLRGESSPTLRWIVGVAGALGVEPYELLLPKGKRVGRTED